MLWNLRLVTLIACSFERLELSKGTKKMGLRKYVLFPCLQLLLFRFWWCTLSRSNYFSPHVKGCCMGTPTEDSWPGVSLLSGFPNEVIQAQPEVTLCFTFDNTIQHFWKELIFKVWVFFFLLIWIFKVWLTNQILCCLYSILDLSLDTLKLVELIFFRGFFAWTQACG